jgi:hypothetical protein
MRRSAPRKHNSPTRPSAPDRVARVLKWVGAVTAVLTLVFGLRTLFTWISDTRMQRRQVTDLVETAQQQAKEKEFPAAWASLTRASQIRDTPEVDTAKEDVAMAWLEDGHPGPDKPFATIVDAVAPTLDAALLHAQGTRRADILSHIGWGKFLRSRDSVTEDPEPQYREAISIDPRNPYANAMLGHWIIWNGGAVPEARPYFDAAVASGRALVFVRDFQLAALSDQGDDEDFELIRVVNSMRQRHEPLDAETNRYVRWVYGIHVDRGPSAPFGPPLSQILPVADQLATFEWLLADPNAAGTDELICTYVLGLLQEAAGQRQQALETLQALRIKIGRIEPTFTPQLDASIVRLSRSAKRP